MGNAQKDVKNDVTTPGLLSFPVAATTKLYAGTLGMTNSSGNATDTVSNSVKVWGRVEKQVDNTSGGAGDLWVDVRQGVPMYVNNDTTNAITNALPRGAYVYAVDNQTVGSSDVGGTLPVAGYLLDVPASGQPNYGKVLIMVGQARPDALNPDLAGQNPAAFRMRGVVTSNVSNLASFTVAATDLTYVAGNQVLLVNQTTASQNGPYVVGTVTTGTAPLTRPDWWAAGSVQPSGAQFIVSEGTQGAGSKWLVQTAGSITVDTTSTTIVCPDGNWVQGVSTAVGTMANPSSYFFAAALLKPRLTGIFMVDLDVAWSGNTTADSVTLALVTDTSASGTIASANKVAHGVAGIGAYGTNGSDWESVDTNGGAVLTYNGAAFNTSAVTQASEVNATLTGLLTTNGSGQQKFGFHGIVYNATPSGTTKTAFTLGNTVAFGVKVSATNTITVSSVRMTVRELASQ